MSLQANYNAVFTIDRLVRIGDEDGTPLYDTTTVAISGWFDEIEVRGMDEPRREENPPYSDQRALFMCNVDSGIQQDDAGIMVLSLPGGATLSRGRWQVSLLRTAPIPAGAHHIEVQLQGLKESK